MKRILALLLSVLGVALTTGSLPQAQSCQSNAIVCENNLTGNPSSEWDIEGAGDATLQGFATDISVNNGGTVHFKVSTTAALFQMNIYRMGYYGGMGARKVATIAGVAGTNQAACLTNATTLLVDCGNWTESTSWTIPATSVSGIYFAKLTRADTGGSSHIMFIVRDDASTSDLLFQTSDTTWQAYNQYGGNSTYVGTPQAAYKVSYNRPFATRGQPVGFGTSNWVFYTEYPMVRWLESNGYDVSYFTGVDADRSGALIRNHKVFMSVGHDEYWSGAQRTNVEAARAAGVHLAFFSGNELFWKTRFESSIDGSNTPYRTLVTYKETHANAVIDPLDPPTWTGTWMDPRFSPPADGGRPGNALSGQFYAVNRGSAAITVPVAYSALRFWRNTSIAQLLAGQTATLGSQTIGYEWDTDADNGARPPGLIDLSLTTVAATEVFSDWGNVVAPATVKHSLTLYRHSSGALVFGAGTVQWSWGLDINHDIGPDSGPSKPDLNIQQATMNVLGDMAVQPQTRQAGLFAAVPSNDVAPPTSTITSPVNGVNLAAETTVTIAGTASDAGGGAVGGVEVSLDGGSRWRKATGTTHWTYTWVPGTLGTTNIRSRAVDDSGNLEAPGSGIAINITQAICPCSLWNSSYIPWAVDGGDPNAIEVGTKFQTDLNGQITALRFYKAAANTGSHTGHIWTAGGQLLGSLTFTGETASGWQQTSFATPIPITPNTVYVASYHTNVGHYSGDSYYFGVSGVDQWPLHAPATGASGGNGLYSYGAASIFPTSTFQAENYWVDVVIGPVDSVPPTVTITAPANGAALTGSVAVSATASDNLNAVAGVQFKLDGVNLGAEDTTNPYGITWNTTANSNSPHVLTAVARDTSGNTTTSTPVAVTVFNVDTIPPTVSITAPATGATVVGIVNVTATAADNNAVAGLQFLLDGAPLGSELTAAPYAFAWSTITSANGSHTLSARARDVVGNQTTSTVVTVLVVNGAPVIDAQVSMDKPSATTTIASPAFSTTASNELLLAFIGIDDPGVNTVTKITTTGLTWELVKRTNAQLGPSEIWRAFAPTVLTNVIATATFAQGAAASLTVISFSGVDTSGTNGSGAIGATASGSAPAGAPTATLTATRANAWVFGVGTDWSAGGNRTLSASQTLVHQYTATNSASFWTQRVTNPVSASGVSVTVDDTAPTVDRYNLTICEVLPPTWSISGTVSPTGTGTTLTLSGTSAGSATADAAGNFTFAGLANGSYTVAPSKTGFTFNPTSQPVTVNGANVSTVVFTITPLDTTPPTVLSVAPVNGATGVSVMAISATATFSEAMSGATITTSTMVLRDPGNAIVTCTVGYNTGTHIATLTPNAPLAAFTTYTATITSGVGGVTDLAGNPLANDVVWSFTTGATPTCPCTIWNASATPAQIANDPSAVEVGVRFRADASGTISGARFYKAASNTGTHIGSLWTNSGALLATALFTGESASGWQQVNFATPVPVTANTTYVVSYHTNTGNYGVDGAYFASAGADNTPLHALATGVDGADGLYLYGAGAFPTQSYNGANYWVDVVYNAGPPDTTPPTVLSVAPVNGATSVSVAVGATATFSEAMNAATITTSTMVLRDPGNAVVLSTVGYNVSAHVATLMPTATLAAFTTYTATITSGVGGVTDLAGNPLASDVVWSFTTGAAPTGPTCPCTIWNASATPAQIANDSSAVELGVRFRADGNGTISGARFYKAATNTGTHIGSLWTSSGALLATAQFIGESGSGWQEVSFPAPVPITANTTYVVSYHTNAGNYGIDGAYFASAGADNAPLHALATGVDGADGLYLYGAGAFPTQSYNGANYWVDVVYNTGPPDTTPPTVLSVAPSNGATGVSVSGSATATFAEAMTGATITPSTMVLRDPGNALVSSSVSYNASTHVATLTPTATLTASTTYTATITGGVGGVTDLAGNPLASDVVWSFTTGTGPTCPCTIWNASATPDQIANDSSAVELGVRFRADANGTISGVRFYKAATNTGTHIGSLWTSSGTLLATAQFTGESDSGWQQVNFATPVAIAANTTYVVSYHTNTGNYGVDHGYFTSAGADNAPLHALATGVDGADGLYLYGGGAFPTESYNAANYWVDVVFGPM